MTSTFLLNNLSNIHTEINNTARHKIIFIVLISNTGGKRGYLPPGDFWHSKTYFRRVWNGFWRKFAVSLLNSVWLIEYFDVKSIVLRLFCFALNSSKNLYKIPFPISPSLRHFQRQLLLCTWRHVFGHDNHRQEQNHFFCLGTLLTPFSFFMGRKIEGL